MLMATDGTRGRRAGTSTTRLFTQRPGSGSRPCGSSRSSRSAPARGGRSSSRCPSTGLRVNGRMG
eukprot:4197468-Pyramimonas_sp.AAC.1